MKQKASRSTSNYGGFNDADKDDVFLSDETPAVPYSHRHREAKATCLGRAIHLVKRRVTMG